MSRSTGVYMIRLHVVVATSLHGDSLGLEVEKLHSVVVWVAFIWRRVAGEDDWLVRDLL